MVARPSYLHNGISYIGKIASLYWIRALHIHDLMQKRCNSSAFLDGWMWKRHNSIAHAATHWSCAYSAIYGSIRSDYIKIWIKQSGNIWWLISLCHAESIFASINTYFQFLSFLDIKLAQGVVFFLHEDMEPIYPSKSTSLLLMSWPCKEPGHQQLCYWPCSFQIL